MCVIQLHPIFCGLEAAGTNSSEVVSYILSPLSLDWHCWLHGFRTDHLPVCPLGVAVCRCQPPAGGWRGAYRSANGSGLVITGYEWHHWHTLPPKYAQHPLLKRSACHHGDEQCWHMNVNRMSVWPEDD